jgi:hypothetical protein
VWDATACLGQYPSHLKSHCLFCFSCLGYAEGMQATQGLHSAMQTILCACSLRALLTVCRRGVCDQPVGTRHFACHARAAAQPGAVLCGCHHIQGNLVLLFKLPNALLRPLYNPQADVACGWRGLRLAQGWVGGRMACTLNVSLWAHTLNVWGAYVVIVACVCSSAA